MYRQEYAEIILFYVLLFGIVAGSLFANAYLVSLHILGPDWDLEIMIFGTSMKPTLEYGDSICVKVGNSSAFSVLPNITILTFQKPRPSAEFGGIELATHRVIDSAVGGNGLVYFKTKGDNNEYADDWADFRGEEYTWNGMISDRLLVGKVMAVRRGYAVWQPLVVMGTIVASITILAFVLVVSSLKDVS